MNDSTSNRQEDDKRRRVLDGAAGVFLSYGFGRTTMDDIARAADMSRPALYLLFRNKADIYRAIAEVFFAESEAAARSALAQPGSLGERMSGFVEAGLMCLLERIVASPHGAEILDVKHSLAADELKAWRGRMADMLAAVIAGHAGDLAATGLSPRLVADHFLDAMEGIKGRVGDLDAMRGEVTALIRLVERAVSR